MEASARRTAGLVLAGLAVIVAGCGGDSRPREYMIASTEGCLWSKGGQLDLGHSHLDPIALSASRGAFRATINGHDVIISLAANASEARTLKQRYEATPHKGSEFARERNVVLSWPHTPEQADRNLVKTCLKH